MIIDSLKSLAVPIDSLQGLPGNPRRGDVDAVATSLSRFGQRKPIVVRKDDGTIIAGNHTWQAAKKLGWSEIAVAYVGDDDVTAQAYALADNRTAELGDYDDELLKALIDSVGQIDPELLKDTGWSDDAVKELLEKIELANPKVIDEDEVPEPPIEPKTKLGDLWQVGLHRILCGDSLEKSNLDRVTEGLKVKCVLTDPPYGINLDTDWSKIENNPIKGNNYRKIANDDIPFDASFLADYFADIKEQFWWGANYYYRTLTNADLNGSWLVWDKRNESSDTVIGSGFELCWSKTKHKQDLLRYLWNGFTARERDSARVHPTQKPVAMLQEILDRWADKDCVVIDPFAGSGSTLVAAHQTNRIGYGIELDRGYVDIIIERLEKITGEKAVLVSNAESTKA
jgi:DNA modification methylase